MEENQLKEILNNYKKENETEQESIITEVIEDSEINKNNNELNNTKVEIVSQQRQEFNIQTFSENYRMAAQLAKSTIIPQTYQNKPENVIVAIGMAQKIGLDPFTIMQNLNIIKGKTSWSGSFCRTLIEKSNKYSNLKLIFVGEKGTDTYGCYMQGISKETGELIKGPEVNMKMAKSENWTSNPKWNNMTELMLSYRATSFFARVYVPEALNGVQTTEEIEDIYGSKNESKREMKDVL